jgi:hypothetical protein
MFLRWSLALVIGQASLLLLLRAHRGAVQGGVHPALAGALAAVELAAVALFLIPKTLGLGARLLWIVLVIAALVHLHTGDPPPMVFLVYAAAIWVVLQEAGASKIRPT